MPVRCGGDPEQERILRKAYFRQDELVEHKDAGAPSHGINEALGDIYRELTKVDFSEEYIRQKIKHLERVIEQSKSSLNPNALQSIAKLAGEPQVREILRGYLERNKEFIEFTKELSINPELKTILLEIAETQRFVSENVGKLSKGERLKQGKTLEKAISKIERYVSKRKQEMAQCRKMMR